MSQVRFIQMAVACIPFLFNSMGFAQSPSIPSKTEVLQSHSHQEFPVELTANSLFLYQSSNFYSGDQSATSLNTNPNGLSIREVEFEVTAQVDKYSKIEIQLSLAPQYEVDNNEVEETWEFAPEEAYVISTYFSNLEWKLGKFRAPLGKHNLLHLDNYPFIHAPLANTFLLGDEGFADLGASVAWAAPLPWTSKFIYQHLKGKGENEQFNSPSPGDGVNLLKWQNEFNPHQQVEIELGVSAAQGTNSYKKNTTLAALDFTLNWSPAENFKYALIEFSAEYLSRQMERNGLDGVEKEKATGHAYWIQYNINEKWSALS